MPGSAAGLALLLWAQQVSAAEPLATLDWLSGEWEAVDQSGPHVLDRTIERWSRPAGGVMLGTSQSIRRIESSFTMDVSETTRAFEFMRIAAEGTGAVTFYASPSGAPPVPFKLIAREARQATFENPQNDYPQRIVYRREGDRLWAAISTMDGSRRQSWRFLLRQPR